MAEKVYNWTDDPMVSGVADCNTDVVNDCLMHLKYENTTDAIQNMYTTGQVETQTRGFNQLQQMKHSTFDLSKFTVVGSPTITDDGVASGFSKSDYIDTILLPYDKLNYCITLKDYKYLDGQSFIFGNRNVVNEISLNVIFHSNKILLFASSTGKSWDIANNVVSSSTFVSGRIYDISFVRENGSLYKVVVYDHSSNTTTTEITVTTNSNLFNSSRLIAIGAGSWESYTGSLDLKQFSITVDGKEVFSGNKTGIDVIKPDNYTVVGSPVISDDGVASGFSTSNYITYLSQNLRDNFDIIFPKFKISDVTQNVSFLFTTSGHGLRVQLNSGKIRTLAFYGSDQYPVIQGTTALQNNIEYLYRVTRTKQDNTYTLTAFLSSDNGQTWAQEAQITMTQDLYNSGLVGYLGSNPNSGTQIFNGSIDLNSFKIYVDGNLVYQPCLKIPYTESKTGSKIVDVAYRDRVIDLYEQEGQAGYYTIDEENKNFTLPMGEIYGMIEQKGTYQPPLLSTMWSDHLLNDMSWLRADTFSWQDGNTYSLVYNELLAEYNNSASTTETEGSITFKRTPKWYKIALANQESAILNKYNTDGIAWYYILDTANKKFKLPRAKHPSLVTSTSTAPVVYSQHNGSVPQQQAVLPVFNVADNSKIYYTRPYINNGASNQGIISSAVTDTLPPDAVTLYEVDLSTNVKDYNMYLYFYVGNFTKSAEAQTAGLNAELFNGKADVDTPSIQAPYITDTYVNGTSWYRIWSDGWCEQGGVFKNTSNKQSVTLLQNYINTNYNVQITIFNSYEGQSTSNIRVNSKSTSSFEVWVEKEERPIMWRACGYIS